MILPSLTSLASRSRCFHPTHGLRDVDYYFLSTITSAFDLPKHPNRPSRASILGRVLAAWALLLTVAIYAPNTTIANVTAALAVLCQTLATIFATSINLIAQAAVSMSAGAGRVDLIATLVQALTTAVNTGLAPVYAGALSIVTPGLRALVEAVATMLSMPP